MDNHINWSSKKEAYKIDLTKIDTEPTSVVISLGVMALSGESQEEIPPLWDKLDIEALDDLFDRASNPPPENSKVIFHYHGFEVVVSGENNLLLRPEDTEPISKPMRG